MAAWESPCTSTWRESVSLTGVREKPDFLFSIPTIYILPLQRLATKPGILNSPSSMLSSLLASLYEVHILHSLTKPTPATLSVTEKITFVLFSCWMVLFLCEMYHRLFIFPLFSPFAFQSTFFSHLPTVPGSFHLSSPLPATFQWSPR